MPKNTRLARVVLEEPWIASPKQKPFLSLLGKLIHLKPCMYVNGVTVFVKERQPSNELQVLCGDRLPHSATGIFEILDAFDLQRRLCILEEGSGPACCISQPQTRAF